MGEKIDLFLIEDTESKDVDDSHFYVWGETGRSIHGIRQLRELIKQIKKEELK